MDLIGLKTEVSIPAPWINRSEAHHGPSVGYVLPNDEVRIFKNVKE